jgi:hypothetical protein
MTLRNIINSLDAQGEYAAKRPSMNGYCKKLPVEAEDDGRKTATLAFYGRVEDAPVFKFAIENGVVTGIEGEPSATVEFINALLADDWEIGKADELEKARKCKGWM